MQAILLSIGDELASGLTINTNSAWLAQELAQLGIRTIGHITVGDEVSAIVTAIREACEHLELEPTDHNASSTLLISGGLGPTEDDVTRSALADALSQELIEDPDAMVQIERWFKKIGRPMSASNRLQALRPSGATVIENTAGTAPGLWVQHGSTRIFVMPGVPREMKAMFANSVLPMLKETLSQSTGPAATVTRTAKINTFGVGESVLGEKIADLMQRRDSDELSVGTTVHDGIVSVRIYATGTEERANTLIAQVRATVRERVGPLVFSENEESLEGAVDRLLKDKKQTIATAESCTGGLLATLLTNTPGSSAYFQRGWVTYSNVAKIAELEVPADLIAEHGAVSEHVARAMADGARRRAASDLALSITGIAGPDGGTESKPVGTVWIALASATETAARRFIFPGNRDQIRLRTAQMALALLRWKLLDLSPPV